MVESLYSIVMLCYATALVWYLSAILLSSFYSLQKIIEVILKINVSKLKKKKDNVIFNANINLFHSIHKFTSPVHTGEVCALTKSATITPSPTVPNVGNRAPFDVKIRLNKNRYLRLRLWFACM